MTTLLITLSLAIAASQTAFAQVPWVAMPGAPVYSLDQWAGNVMEWSSPQTSTLWCLARERVHAGPGLAYYHDRVFRTGDSGLSWQEAPMSNWNNSTNTTPASGNYITEISAVDAQTAWILKHNINNRVSSLLRTTTGPGGFTPIINVLPAGFARIHFFNSTVGIAITTVRAGAITWPIQRTTDGGFTWVAVPNSLGATVVNTLGLHLGPKTGFASTLWQTVGTNLLRTTDMGLTWTVAPSSGAVTFEEDGLHGMSYGYDTSTVPYTPKLKRTTDGGLSWTDIAFSGQPGLTAITAVHGLPGAYISTDFRYPGASNRALVRGAVSRDYGSTWQVSYTNFLSGAIKSLMATSPTHIWAATDLAAGSPNEPMIMRYTGVALAAKNPLGAEFALGAYPNPTSATFQIEGELQGQEEVRVYDGVGRLCQQEKVSNTRRIIDLSSQPAGLYHLVLTTATGSTRSLRVSKTQ